MLGELMIKEESKDQNKQKDMIKKLKLYLIKVNKIYLRTSIKIR